MTEVLHLTFNERDEEIISSIINDRRNTFLSGPGGTGKSCMIREIRKRLALMERPVAITATTGVAALGVGGSTLHSFLGIGIGTGTVEQLYKKIQGSTKYKARWKDTKVLIIDEVSMLGGELFDKIESLGRLVRKNQAPFGGMQVVISGDLLQLPPINAKWIFESHAWSSMKFMTYTLTESRRYKNDDYFNLLLRVREGKQTDADVAILESRYQEYHKQKSAIKKWEIKPTILYSRRLDVAEFNLKELAKLKGGEIEYQAEDSFECYGQKYRVSDKQKEFYVKLMTDVIPDSVVLKVGAQVMLRKNLDVDNGLVNGSRGVVMAIDERTYTVRVKFKSGVEMELDAEAEFEFWDDEIHYKRKQIPLILAYALTIHRAQGATLDFAVADAGLSVFADSQAYVALSRVRDLSGLFLSNFDKSAIKVNQVALAFVEKLKREQQDVEQ